jgi:4-diphosphocytidyl-2-C-methyl-D-erythritol kinase
VSGGAAALWLPACAKLNLFLEVTGQRADGYHTLDTVFHALALRDDLSVRHRSRGVTIAVSADHERLLVPDDERNLAVRALEALRAEVGHAGGFHVDLHKRIPNGGGLGGGSSNAAAALRIANALLGDPLDADGLAKLAVSLGADVPFFLGGGTQRGRGIGEVLTPLPHDERHFVLLLPPYGCATAEVYKIHARRLEAGGYGDTFPRNSVWEDRDAGMGYSLYNQLEQAAEQLRPELGRLRRAVGDAGYEHVRMTGSGSTLFVRTEDGESAARCLRDLERALASSEHEGVTLEVTRSAGHPAASLASDALPDTLRRPPPA